MKITPLLALMSLAAPYYPTQIELDSSALEHADSAESKMFREDAHRDVLRDVAMLLQSEGVPLTRPERGEEAEKLESDGVSFVDGLATNANVVVRLSWKTFPLAYVVQIEVTPPEGTTVALPMLVCDSPCEFSQIIDVIATKKAEILALLDATPQTKPPHPSAHVKPRPKPITAMGITGSVVAVVGVAPLAFGAIWFERGISTKSAGDGRTSTERDFRGPSTIAALSVGSIAIAGGLTVLIVDLVRQQKRRRTSSHAMLVPGPFGVELTGRF